MNIYLLLTAITAFLFGIFLYYHKWKLKHIISIVFSFIFVFIFATYGKEILTPIWANANASTLWLIMFLLIYLGGGIIGSIPFIIDGIQKGDKKKIWHIIRFWLVIGLVYVAIDNFSFGPFAVGPNSPYIGQNLCHLNPTYYAEDVFSGCLIQSIGINPFGELASFLCYQMYSLLLLFLAGLLVGWKYLEKVIYPK